MARFFFDAHDGFEVRDDIGRDLPDREAARQAAVRLAADFAKDACNLTSAWLIVVTVRDEANTVVCTIRLVCQID
jgi:hypothetical protein